MSTSNKITKVAIVGAGGRSGKAMTQELLETGTHTVTAVTRADSTSPLPSGIAVAKVDYNDHDSLVTALKGQQALIITMGTTAPPDTQSKLIRAAADADVLWILPNEWSPDSDNAALCKDVGLFARLASTREEITKLGKSSYLAVTCGFWYEWSVAIADAYGFDIANRKATFFDDGETKTNMSTWPQVGRAVAALLSLPIKPENGDKEHSLEHFRNKNVYISSFTVSQRHMLNSLIRVTGTKEANWTIEKVPAAKRFGDAAEAMAKGDRMAFVKTMYTRVFYKDGVGLFESKGLANGILGLPEEEIDEFTKVAVERSQGNPYA